MTIEPKNLRTRIDERGILWTPDPGKSHFDFDKLRADAIHDAKIAHEQRDVIRKLVDGLLPKFNETCDSKNCPICELRKLAAPYLED